MNFFPFHIGDYAFHTRHLTLMEDLAYRRVLDLYYSRDGVLPEGVARLVGMAGHEADVATILAEFFPGGINKRADEEIAKMRAKQENARASVAKRAGVTQAPRERDASVIEASTTNNQEPVTKNQEIPPSGVRGAKPSRKCPQDFEITSQMSAWARGEVPGLNLEAETAKFRDHTFQASCVDWPGRWRNWMRKAHESLPKARASPQSFRERDEQAAAARHAEFTGRKVDALDVIDMEPRHARIGNG